MTMTCNPVDDGVKSAALLDARNATHRACTCSARSCCAHAAPATSPELRTTLMRSPPIFTTTSHLTPHTTTRKVQGVCMADKTTRPFPAIARAPLVSCGDSNPGLREVQGFLQRLGYLVEGTFEAGRLDDATSSALALYQEHHRLKVTGAFDAQTRDQMTAPRCGVPDLIGGVRFTTLCPWIHPCLTFAFDVGTSDVPGNAEFQAVHDAVATWAAATPLTFTQVGVAQNPDIVIGWRPADDPDNHLPGTIAHANFPPGCGFLGDETMPRPVHFIDPGNNWAIDKVIFSFDVQSVALHELGHVLGLGHSVVDGAVMKSDLSINLTRRELAGDDLAGIERLYPSAILTPGTVTIRQQSTGRFLDAHEIADKDFQLVTRPEQGNNTQRWVLAQVGTVVMIRQKSSGRFLDAFETRNNDFRLVTRDPNVSEAQRWIVMHGTDGTVTIRQLSSNRFVDAHQIPERDFAVVTRAAQNNDTQRWVFAPVGAVFTMQQASNGRYVDAHEHAGEDFRLVTRPAQHNDTQRWVFLPDPDRLGTYTIQQLSNGRFVDAHVTSSEDFRVVTRTRQNNDTQRWVVTDIGKGLFRLQQRSTGRFLDAHEHAGEDFRLVTRTAQDNDTQGWILTQIGRVYTIQQLSNGRFVDAHEHAGQDFRLVTRTAQLNDTQLWVVLHLGNGKHTIQHLSNGRYVDAHEHAGEDFRLVTRTRQENDTQRWLITGV